MVDGVEIASFRSVSMTFPRGTPSDVLLPFSGDNVNGFSPSDRTPDPERLLGAYFHSAATINHVRSLLSSGYASLPTSKQEGVPWSLPLEHVRSPELLASYEEIVKNLSDAMEFMNVVGARGGLSGELDKAEIWMSHEVRRFTPWGPPRTDDRILGLDVGIRERTDEGVADSCFCEDGRVWGARILLHQRVSVHVYCRWKHTDEVSVDTLSCVFTDGRSQSDTNPLPQWIGDRTRSITGAHVEFFRGIFLLSTSQVERGLTVLDRRSSQPDRNQSWPHVGPRRARASPQYRRSQQGARESDAHLALRCRPR